MSPTELLARAVSDFPVMYLDTGIQNQLLAKALEAYQEKVGPVANLTFPVDVTEIETPEDFMSLAIAMDECCVYHEAKESEGVITVTEQPGGICPFLYSSVKPFRVWYFQDFQGWDSDADLPPESIHLISKYLIALIDVLNSERGRAVAQSTGLDLEFPSDQELRERLDTAALAMEESQAIIPGVVIM